MMRWPRTFDFLLVDVGVEDPVEPLLGGAMLSPKEAKPMIGERILFRSMATPCERQAEPESASHRAIAGHVSLSVREPMKRPMCPPGTSFFSIRPLGVPTRVSAAKTCSLVVMSSLSPARR